MANTFTNQTVSPVATTSLVAISPTVSSGQQVTIIGCSLANTGSSPITVDVAVATGVGPSWTTTTYIVKQATVPVGGSLVVIGAEEKVVLISGNTLVARSSTANSCDAVVSLLIIA